MASALPDMISALFKRLSANPSSSESDFESLTARFSNLSLKGEEHSNNDELLRWVKFAESFLKNSDAPLKALTDLNEELIPKSVLLGNGLKPSPADVIVYVAVHSYVNGLSKSDRAKFPHLLRWADYIQNREDIQPFKKIVIDKPAFVLPAAANTPQVSKPLKKVEDPNPKKAVEEPKEAGKSDNVSKGKKSADIQKKKVEESQASQEKKKLPEKDTEKKDEELSVSLLKIQIGQIRKAWKHPSADSLLVEEIDVGEAKCRQVVSGLAKYCTPEELTNRRVVLITNVKPGKLRDVMSEGLVLCASSKDHTVVEPLIAPDGAKVGECVTFSGIDGKPEEVLNPKKKQLDKITPNLFTDEKGVATFKGIPFTTSSGPCTSSIPNASIK